MNRDSQPTYVGPGFISLLAITFIVLKLTNVIDWSWWWVLAPVWGSAVLGLLLFLVLLVIVGVATKGLKDLIDQ